MSKLLNRALRPLAALSIVGAVAAVAAVAAFALLAMPNSQQPVEAQAAAAVTVAAPASGADDYGEKVTISVTAGSTIANNNILSFTIPGYNASGGTVPAGVTDAATAPVIARYACTVEVVNASDANIISGSPIGSAYGCKTNADGDAVIGYFQVASAAAVPVFAVTVTNIVLDPDRSAASSIQKVLTWTAAASTNLNLETFDTTDTKTNFGYAASADPPGHNLFVPGTDNADVDSTTSNASVGIQLRIGALPRDLDSGSSVVLYLEDDYVVPDRIGERSLWFTVAGVPMPGSTNEADAGRHYPTDGVEIDTDNYYGGDDDTHIRVYIPDMYIGDVDGTSLGFQHPVAGQTLTLVIHKNAGIKNPSEAGTHSIGYSLLDVNENVGNPEVALPVGNTYAKVSLSDDDDDRGKVVTATGSGFKNGVSGSVRVKYYAQGAAGATTTVGKWTAPAAGSAEGTRGTLSRDGDPDAAVADAAAVAAVKSVKGTSYAIAVDDVMNEEETCIDIMRNGIELGSGNNIVGSDDRVSIDFTVSNPPFGPGKWNLLCMADGTGRLAITDVQHFNLDSSITVTPKTVRAGEQVTVNGFDYPPGAGFGWVRVVGQPVSGVSNSRAAGDNGRASVDFDMPGALKGTVRVEACWETPGLAEGTDCDGIENTTITVAPSELTLSKTEVRANESVIIRGANFSTLSGDRNDLVSAKIGDANLMPADGNLADIEVSSSGQFSATFAIWSTHSNNPALSPGEHSITIEDAEGFAGSATITIVEPTVSVTPDTAGPRDYVVISGANWPVKNDDGGDTADITITIRGGGLTDEEENEEADANGNWSHRYRIPGNVGIPSTLTVQASYGSNDLTQTANFDIRPAELEIAPATVVPGAELTLNAAGFTLYDGNIEVKIGSLNVAVPTGTNTDGQGNINDLVITVPSLDAGVYTVQLKVGGADGTVAIGEVTVLEDDTGGEADLPEALDALGDNLVRVFHFNNSNKTWSFYDPRPEFAELNTLSALSTGQSYWILVNENASVTLNAQARNLTCLNGECWNNLVW